MRPMGRLALGLAMVWLNFHVVGLDVLPNPVGWVVAALALREVADRHPTLKLAAWCAAAAGAVSVISWVPVWGAPPAPPTPVVIVEGLLGVVVVVSVCTAFVVLLADSAPSIARRANVIRWLDPAVSLAGTALLGASALPSSSIPDSGSGLLTVVAVLLVAIGLVVRIVFLVLVVRHGDLLTGETDAVRPVEDDDDYGLVDRPDQSSGW